MVYCETSTNLNSVGGIQMQENQITQVMQMLGTVVSQLGRIEQRLDKIEQRLDKIEKRMDALEKRMDALELRMDAVEWRLEKLEMGATAYESRFEAIETELHRLRALFEENERTLAVILDVLSNYVKKSEKVDRHDGLLIAQRHDLDITQSALKFHIQDKKVHVSPKPGRPKKEHHESET